MLGPMSSNHQPDQTPNSKTKSYQWRGAWWGGQVHWRGVGCWYRADSAPGSPWSSNLTFRKVEDICPLYIHTLYYSLLYVHVQYGNVSVFTSADCNKEGRRREWSPSKALLRKETNFNRIVFLATRNHHTPVCRQGGPQMIRGRYQVEPHSSWLTHLEKQRCWLMGKSSDLEAGGLDLFKNLEAGGCSLDSPTCTSWLRIVA